MFLGVHRVLLDANVLYSRTLRDWLCLLALDEQTRVYSIYTSEDIIAEAVHHLRKKHPRWPGALTAAVRRNLMDTVGDGLVTDFHVPGDFTGRDEGDAHVHAAALACRADIVVSNDDSRHFAEDPDDLPYEVWGADEFLCHVDDVAPGVVAEVTRQQVAYWMERQGEADLPLRLRNAAAPLFAERVRRHLQTL